MIKYKKRSSIKNLVKKERQNIESYNLSQSTIRRNLENYIREFDKMPFKDTSFKIILLNDFNNAIGQIDNNIQDLSSLTDILEILETQDELSSTDVDIYNKLYGRLEKNVELVQNIIHKSISRFNNITISNDEKTTKFLAKCKKELMSTLPSDFSFDDDGENDSTPKASLVTEKGNSSSTDGVDYSSSDLLFFFPKSEHDNLVISTIQNSYKIVFDNETAKISIEKENFNMTLKTSGVQISNPKSNNVLFINHKDSKYTIVTNNQIETPHSIQVSKISKNGDFLEIEVAPEILSIYIEDNVIRFDENSNIVHIEQPSVVEKFVEKVVSKPSARREARAAEEAAEKVTEEIVEDFPDDKVKDNDTLVISDSSQTVILPYKVSELEDKLKKNKKYHTLRDVIDNEYTLPMDTFKNPIKSRFREAFQLIKKKEHGSIKEAIELGFELMFQSDLNPAVIAACKDLDELDIYLDCLDDNELDKFSCFKISYNVPPTSKKGRK